MTPGRSGKPAHLATAPANPSAAPLFALLLVLGSMLTMLPSLAHATLSASLDRYQISMGDTVVLTISSDSDADPNDVDLSPLQRDFDILSRRSSVNTQFINGQREQRRELFLEITPRREGKLQIPVFSAGGERSLPVEVTVSAQSTLDPGDEIVLFEAEVDRLEAYVQGQVLLTLRVQQAVTLDSRSITELEVDGAVVKTLGQNSFQRTIDGRPWLVHEIRVALFPQASGELRIPAQTFSGRLSSGRRSLFDSRPAGRLLRRSTEEVVVTVKPRPGSFNDPVWLPARELNLEEQWSGPIEELRVGDSITRSITLTAEGLQGSQLPPITIDAPDGLRIYPDQPAINEVDGDSGVTGIRTDNLALVAVRPGDYDIPPLVVRWWDTERDVPREARLPGRRVRVVAAPLPEPTVVNSDSDLAPENTTTDARASAGYWPWLAAFLGLGWLGTTVYAWRRRSPASVRGVAEKDSAPVAASAARKRLLKACGRGEATLARQHLGDWLRAAGYRGTLDEWVAAQNSPALGRALRDLDRYLFGAQAAGVTTPGASTAGWDGSALANAIKGVDDKALNDSLAASRGAQALPPLYPSAG